MPGAPWDRSAPGATRWTRWAMVGLATTGLAVAPGCRDGAEREEARRLIGQLDRLRDSPPETRQPLIEALAREHPEGTAAREARDRCLAAYRALYDGTALASSARLQLALPSPSPTALRDLAEAEAKIEVSTREMPKCNEALAALRRLTR